MNIFIVGIGGKMGKAVSERATALGISVAGGLDVISSPVYPTFAHADDVNVPFDVIIDFSRPETLSDVRKLCEKTKRPCVLATTGYGKEDEETIRALSRSVPVFKSANMSLGVNVLSYLTEKAARMLDGFDVEIIERHHNQKADAPSGTAKMLCAAVERGASYTPQYTHGREGIQPRKKGEIGVHAVRGGTEVGTHEVGFYGTDERVTLTHVATNRAIFADGALKAAAFLLSQKNGLYDMNDLLKTVID